MSARFFQRCPMRLILSLIAMLYATWIYADSFPQNTPTYSGSSSTTSGSSTPGSDNFGSLVQQDTSQAMQVFQGVNYQKLSGSEGQSDFFSNTSSDSNPPDLNQLFTVFQGTQQGNQP